MKSFLMVGITTLFIFLIASRQSIVSAQGMMGFFNCAQITDADFEKIGEYFMGQSIGNTQRHIAMNDMMKRMMGEKGEEQAHQAMGKRLSGCDTSAAFPLQNTGFLSMMGVLGMMGGNQWGGGISGMMNNGLGIFGAITWILIVLFLILGIKYYWKGINKKK